MAPSVWTYPQLGHVLANVCKHKIATVLHTCCCGCTGQHICHRQGFTASMRFSITNVLRLPGQCWLSRSGSTVPMCSRPSCMPECGCRSSSMHGENTDVVQKSSSMKQSVGLRVVVCVPARSPARSSKWECCTCWLVCLLSCSLHQLGTCVKVVRSGTFQHGDG
jgi:hypothetical protein